MAKKNKRNEEALPLTPEEMKAIGEIELGPSRHEQFLNAHYRKLVVALIAFMLLATAAIVYATWRSTQEARSAEAAVAALRVPTGVAEAAGYDAAELDKITAEFPGTHAADTAPLLRGMHLLAAGQQQGIAALQSVIDSSPNDFLRLRAQVTLALHYTDGGELDKAAALWQAVSSAGSSPWEPLALLSLGDISVQQGKADMAEIYYTQLKENCPGSPLSAVARQRLLIVGVDPPVPVAPKPVEQPAQPTPEAIPGWSPMNFSGSSN